MQAAQSFGVFRIHQGCTLPRRFANTPVLKPLVLAHFVGILIALKNLGNDG
jgi:hypothetical protein